LPTAPTPADRERWRSDDLEGTTAAPGAAARPLAEDGLDAYFGLRPENARYLTGFVLGDGEEKVCGASGRFLVSADESVVVDDSRYRLQALEECPASRVVGLAGGFAEAWPELVASLRAIGGAGGAVRRIGVEAGLLSHADWLRLAEATPSLQLVPVDGLVEGQRQLRRRPSWSASGPPAVADGPAGDAARDQAKSAARLALALEWRMRSGAPTGWPSMACLSALAPPCRTARLGSASCATARCCSSISGPGWKAIGRT
jgi:hypothetical protein